jgi:hypothetical protein
VSTETDLSRERAGSLGNETLAVVRELFVLMRTTSSHSSEHPLTIQSAVNLRDLLHAAQPPFSLQFVGKAVFRDTILLPMNLEAYDCAQIVGNAMKNLEVQEVTFERIPSVDDALRFGTAIARGMNGPSDVLGLLRIDGMRWREILNVAGSDGELIDPSMFALTQITLALAEAERLPAATGESWPWVKGVSVIRRLERALAADSQAAIRVIDLAPGDWNVARRAVAAALDVLLVLRMLEVSNSTARAAAHAVLILGINGLRARGGVPLVLAAETALPAILRSPATSRGGVEPHRLRTSAILHGLVRPDKKDGPRVIPLVDLCYELAKARTPEAVPFDLTRVDLLAMATAQAGRRFDAGWVSALITVCGVMPPGCFVLLPDGRIGTVMDAGDSGDPFRPRVMVDGVIFVPDAPLSPMSPAAMQAGG